MPAKSESQRRLMAVARENPGKVFKRNKGVLKMGKGKLTEFMHKAYSPDSITPEGQKLVG